MVSHLLVLGDLPPGPAAAHTARAYCCGGAWGPEAHRAGRIRRRKLGCPTGSNWQLYQCSIYF